MKKLFAALVLCLFLNVQIASAFVPLVIPAIYFGVAAIAVAGTTAAIYYALKAGYVPSVDVVGSIRRTCTMAYVAAKTATAPVSLVEKQVTFKKTFDQLVSACTAKPTKYPNLKAAVFKNDAANAYNPYSTSTPAVNSGFMYNGQAKKITAILGTSGYSPGSRDVSSGPVMDEGGGVYRLYYGLQSWNGGQAYSYFVRINYAAGTTVPVQRTASEVVPLLTGSASGGNATATYQAEADAFAQDSDYAPAITDDATGQNVVPPPVLTPSQVDAYNTSGQATDAAQQAAAQAAAASVAAQNAATKAQDAYNSAQQTAAANPSDVAAQQKAADALAAYQESLAELERTKAQAAAQNVTQAQQAAKDADVQALTSPAGETLHTFDWSALLALRSLLASTFPFNLLSGVASYYSALATSGNSAPVFDLPVFGSTLHVSLSIFDPVATVCRWLFSAIMTGGVVFGMVRFWRGVS